MSCHSRCSSTISINSYSLFSTTSCSLSLTANSVDKYVSYSIQRTRLKFRIRQGSRRLPLRATVLVSFTGVRAMNSSHPRSTPGATGRLFVYHGLSSSQILYLTVERGCVNCPRKPERVVNDSRLAADGETPGSSY